MPQLPSYTDFLICGAGPSGTATALSLLDGGVPAARIVIVDRTPLPRDKLCGGGLTGRAWERLDRWGVCPLGVWDAQAIHLAVEGRGQRVMEPGRLATVDRWELDYRLLQRVTGAGVRFVVAQLREQQRESGCWRIDTSKGEIRCAYLIGADGYASRVRRALGNKRRKSGKLLEVCLVSSAPIEPVLEMDFSPALKGVAGYLWRFPYYHTRDGKLRVKYGIMDRSGEVASSRLRVMLQQYIDAKEGPKAPRSKIVPGYPERYWRPFERAAGERELVVGDAWGVDPLLGEGIAVAFEQAEYAARHLIRAWRSGGRISRCYHLTYPFTATGWNLWFLKKLGDFVYGRGGRFWLGILTADEHLADLSRSPRFGGYGRFARHPLTLTWIAARHLLARLRAASGARSRWSSASRTRRLRSP